MRCGFPLLRQLPQVLCTLLQVHAVHIFSVGEMNEDDCHSEFSLNPLAKVSTTLVPVAVHENPSEVTEQICPPWLPVLCSRIADTRHSDELRQHNSIEFSFRKADVKRVLEHVGDAVERRLQTLGLQILLVTGVDRLAVMTLHAPEGHVDRASLSNVRNGEPTGEDLVTYDWINYDPKS